VTGLPKIDRAYVATEAERADMAKACGIRAGDVRCAETKDQHYKQWKTRKGAFVAVRDLTVAGSTRGEILEFVKHIQAQGAEVIEIETGNRASGGVEMLNRALSIVHARQRGMTPERAAEMARKTKEKRRGDRKREEDARLIWGNLSLSDDECVRQSGWPRATAFAAFAKGGRKKLAAQIAAESKAARARRRK